MWSASFCWCFASPTPARPSKRKVFLGCTPCVHRHPAWRYPKNVDALASVKLSRSYLVKILSHWFMLAIYIQNLQTKNILTIIRPYDYFLCAPLLFYKVYIVYALNISRDRAIGPPYGMNHWIKRGTKRLATPLSVWIWGPLRHWQGMTHGSLPTTGSPMPNATENGDLSATSWWTESRFRLNMA